MNIKYRLHRRDDEAALIRLWSDHSGWDQLSAETWAQRLMHPPVGEARIVVGEDEETGELIAQFPFIPSLLSVDGHDMVTALRPFAPIVSAKARRAGLPLNPLNHPIMAMYRYAVDAMRTRGDGVIYMLPDPRWRRLFRPFPFFQTGAFPLFSRPVPLDVPFALPAGTSVVPFDGWDERVDRLWEQAATLHECLVVRNTKTLPWKVGLGDYTLTAVEREGELIGLVASRQKGDRQWLICDLLAADGGEALQATLAVACNVADEAARAAPPEHAVNKVAILTTPLLQTACEDLGFRRDAYNFTLVVHLLDESLGKAAVDPKRWYLSAND
jgi:hypothetical protein